MSGVVYNRLAKNFFWWYFLIGDTSRLLMVSICELGLKGVAF